MPKTEVNRRSSNDQKWTELRARLKKRDKSCRLIQCLTISEAKLAQSIDGFISRCDCAHMFAASQYPELIYNENNVYRVSHSFHARLDDYKDPLTGDPIERNEWAYWWVRIATRSTTKYNEAEDYISKMREIVGLSY